MVLKNAMIWEVRSAMGAESGGVYVISIGSWMGMDGAQNSASVGGKDLGVPSIRVVMKPPEWLRSPKRAQTA